MEEKLPNQDSLCFPTLLALKSHNGSADVQEIKRFVAQYLKLSDELLEIPTPHPGDSRTKFEYDLAWARTKLKLLGAVSNPSRSIWEVTEKGSSMKEEELNVELLGNKKTESTPYLKWDGIFSKWESILWENNLGKWNFSVRTTTCLRGVGINTEEELLKQSEKSLMRITNFGGRCLQEVQHKLEERELKLTEMKRVKVSPASFPNLLSQGYEPLQISQMTNTKLSKVAERKSTNRTGETLCSCCESIAVSRP